MKDRTDYQAVVEYIKGLLKNQNLTYRDLARGIGLSESGLKKIMGARDGSLQRMSQICSYLGTSLAEAFQRRSEIEFAINYSDKQQQLLLRDQKAFGLYWRLVYERTSVADARLEMRLTQKDVFSILRKLDQAKLLKLLPGDRVQIPPIQLIRWKNSGPLAQKIFGEWSLDLTRSVTTAARQSTTEAHLTLRYFKVKPKTFTALTSAMNDLENEFARRATQDMRSESKDLVHLRWLMAADQKSFLAR